MVLNYEKTGCRTKKSEGILIRITHDIDHVSDRGQPRSHCHSDELLRRVYLNALFTIVYLSENGDIL